MKNKLCAALLWLVSAIAFAQLAPPTSLQNYYSDVNFNNTGMALFDDLAIETAVKHTNYISYSPGIWEASRITDADPSNNANVLLMYGYNNNDRNFITDRSRSKNANGGNQGSDWNREHTFPNSLGVPSLISTGRNVPPYADAHNLRPSDVRMNSNRGNLKFIDGSGNARNISGGWYPGDEWKGDVARIVMYMYLRYGTQCKPNFAVVGRRNTRDSNMINLLLEWNQEDPVSTFEDNRNRYHTNTSNTYAQGNRNPFIDNPYLATLIWGGPTAANRWGTSSGGSNSECVNETFANIPNQSSSYLDRSWNSNNSGLWRARRARTDQSISGKAITIDVRGTTNGSITAPTSSGGIGSLTATTQRAFSGSSGNLEVFVNRRKVGNLPYGSSRRTTTINNINISGNVSIVITETSRRGDRVSVDNLKWTCFGTSKFINKDQNNTSEVFSTTISQNTLTIKSEEKLIYNIFDFLGKNVKTGNINPNNSTVDITNLRQGLYILSVTSQNQTTTKKIIKQ